MDITNKYYFISTGMLKIVKNILKAAVLALAQRFFCGEICDF